MIPLSTLASSLSKSSVVLGTQKFVTTKRCASTTVRLIALQDLPNGKAYKGDVVRVKPGYARNFLVPKKMAVYATPQNFEKYEIPDPDLASEEEKRARLLQESTMSEKDELLLRESDRLKKYLKNKTLKIWRAVDPNSVDAVHPGCVTSKNIRQKLSKQLRIDLDPTEPVHIFSEEPLDMSGLDDDKIQDMVDGFDPESDCKIEIRRLGVYLAKIGLEGGYSVPLKFVVQRRP